MNVSRRLSSNIVCFGSPSIVQHESFRLMLATPNRRNYEDTSSGVFENRRLMPLILGDLGHPAIEKKPFFENFCRLVSAIFQVGCVCPNSLNLEARLWCDQ